MLHYQSCYMRHLVLQHASISKRIFATSPCMNHRRKEERWLATGTYLNRIKLIITNHYLVVKRYYEYTNKYILIICVYKKTHENNTWTTFPFCTNSSNNNCCCSSTIYSRRNIESTCTTGLSIHFKVWFNNHLQKEFEENLKHLSCSL